MEPHHKMVLERLVLRVLKQSYILACHASGQNKILIVEENWWTPNPEAVVRICSSKQVFLKIAQTSQENISVGVSFW